MLLHLLIVFKRFGGVCFDRLLGLRDVGLNLGVGCRLKRLHLFGFAVLLLLLLLLPLVLVRLHLCQIELWHEET